MLSKMKLIGSNIATMLIKHKNLGFNIKKMSSKIKYSILICEILIQNTNIESTFEKRTRNTKATR